MRKHRQAIRIPDSEWGPWMIVVTSALRQHFRDRYGEPKGVHPSRDTDLTGKNKRD